MKLIISLLILLSFSFDCAAQPKVTYATKNSLVINNTNTQHYLTINVYKKGNLLVSQLVAPNGSFQINNLKISNLGHTKRYSIESIYDHRAHTMDTSTHQQRMNNAKYMRDEGALRGCVKKMENDAIIRSLLTGLGAGKLVAMYDVLKTINGNSVPGNRLTTDTLLFSKKGTEVERRLEWIKRQFEDIADIDPFKYCPSLESDIRAYDRTYNALVNDETIQKFAKTNLNRTQSKQTLRQSLDNKTKAVFMQELPGLMIEANVYTSGKQEGIAEKTEGKEISLSLGLLKTGTAKGGNKLRLYLTLSSGESKLNLTPTNQYTGLTLVNNSGGLQSFAVASDKNTTINFYNNYVKAGLKVVLSVEAFVFSVEGGVNSIYQNRVDIKSDKYYTITNNTLMQSTGLPDDYKSLSLYKNYEPGPYWNFGAKVNLFKFKKGLPYNRMAFNVGINILRTDFSNSLLPQTSLETIRYDNNKITERTTIQLQKMPYTIGAQIGINF